MQQITEPPSLQKQNHLQPDHQPPKQPTELPNPYHLPFIIAPPPNQSSPLSQSSSPQPNLLETIQQHLQQQNRRTLKESLIKQSLVKCSVDKEFAYIFDESANKPLLREEQVQEEDRMVMEVDRDQEKICKWLESEQEKTLARLSFRSHVRLMQILDFKVDRLAIVITNFHSYFAQQLQHLNKTRKKPIQWACFSSTLTLQIKSKILQMYELGKLKLLLITPQLFQNQEFHTFECELLTVTDIQLYGQNRPLLNKILSKVAARRVLGCYEYMPEGMRGYVKIPDTGRDFGGEVHYLMKTTEKNKTLMSFIDHCEYNKILIIVPDRRTAHDLSTTLSLSSLKTLNLCQHLPQSLITNFTLPSFLTKQYKNQDLLRKLLEKTSQANIIVSVHFQGLKLIEPQLVVIYSMPEVDRYLEMSPLGRKAALGLVDAEDFYRQRNGITSGNVDVGVVNKAVGYVLERERVLGGDGEGAKKAKRFFSETFEDLMFKKFSVDKQSYSSTSDLKTLKLSKFCSQFQLTRQQSTLLLNTLQQLHLITRPMTNLSYQCLIKQPDVQSLRTLFPNAPISNHRINLLNISNESKMTTKQVTNLMRKNRIRFTVCEEVIPFRVERERTEANVEMVARRVKGCVEGRVRELDRSFGVYEKLAYQSMEFLRRDRMVGRRASLGSYLEGFYKGQDYSQFLPSFRINNLRELAYNQKTIQQCLSQLDDPQLTPHDLVMFLQGIPTPLTCQHQHQPLFKSYYRYRYEDLLELVTKIFAGKRAKLA